MDALNKFSKESCEDYVEYSIYPVESDNSSINLQNLRDECLAHITPYIVQYMWHKEPFSLVTRKHYLHGRMKIGDNVEDEWYVISMLFKLTVLKPNIVVKVWDQDGEVLLIEAADHLPKWAQDPDTAENRVYIYQNQLHLIPIAQNPSQLTPLPVGVPSIEDGVNTVKNFQECTRASNKIQSIIRKRMKSYPDDWSDQEQFTHVIVPKKINNLLKSVPKHLISAAIRCFYTRDILDLRNCRTLKNFPPENLMKAGIPLSKCLYAMLAKQQFKPDKRSNWPMPPQSNRDEYKASDLGFKLTCGFEMLLAQCHGKDKESTIDISSSLDELRYEKFEKSLFENGYFENELEGSQRWKLLTYQAREYFKSSFAQNDSTDSKNDDGKTFSAQLKHFVTQIAKRESDAGIILEKPIESELPMKPPDDDSWLDYEQESFDEMLKSHFNLEKMGAEKFKSAHIPKEDAIPAQMKSFLSAMSNYEGIDSFSAKTSDKDDMNFDLGEFEKTIKRMANMKDCDNVSDIETSDDDDSENSEVDLMNDSSENMDSEWKEYSHQINSELLDAKILSTEADEGPIESLDEIDRPINIDTKVFKNILESYKSESSIPGPASTMLQSLGIDMLSDKL